MTGFVSRILPAAAMLGVAVSATPALAGGDAANGSKLFAQRCAMCHSNKGGPNKLGPALNGVVGRKAGTMQYGYSPALKQLGSAWSPQLLDQWLAMPRKIAPGTRMVLGTPKPQDRADVIAYLTTLK